MKRSRIVHAVRFSFEGVDLWIPLGPALCSAAAGCACVAFLAAKKRVASALAAALAVLAAASAAQQMLEWERFDANPIVSHADFEGSWQRDDRGLVLAADGTFQASDGRRGRWTRLDDFTIQAGGLGFRALEKDGVVALLEIPAGGSGDPGEWNPRNLWRRR